MSLHSWRQICYRGPLIMRCFSYIAEQSFQTDQQGRRLFYLHGPWSLPYIIPDAETEAFLLRRQAIVLRWSFGAILFGLLLLFALRPKILFQPSGFIGFFCLALAVICLVNWSLLRHRLNTLTRLEGAQSFRGFYKGSADKHSVGALALGLIGSLIFVAQGYWLLGSSIPSRFEVAPIVGWLCITFFGLCALAWGYCLLVKLRNR